MSSSERWGLRVTAVATNDGGDDSEHTTETSKPEREADSPNCPNEEWSARVTELVSDFSSAHRLTHPLGRRLVDEHRKTKRR